MKINYLVNLSDTDKAWASRPSALAIVTTGLPKALRFFSLKFTIVVLL